MQFFCTRLKNGDHFGQIYDLHKTRFGTSIHWLVVPRGLCILCLLLRGWLYVNYYIKDYSIFFVTNERNLAVAIFTSALTCIKNSNNNTFRIVRWFLNLKPRPTVPLDFLLISLKIQNESFRLWKRWESKLDNRIIMTHLFEEKSSIINMLY